MNYAKNTQVGIDRSRNEIERILIRYGASDFGYMRREKFIMIAFRAVNRNIRFIVKTPSKERFLKTEKGRQRRSQSLIEKAYDLAVRQQWRTLALGIKAKLAFVEGGIETFEEAFLAQIVLPNGKTVAEVTTPLIEQMYQSGKNIALLNYETGE